MPFLIVEGRKYRVGDSSGQDPFWTIPVDEKNVALEVLSQPSAQPKLVLKTGGRVIAVSVQGLEDEHIYLVEVNGRPLSIAIEEDASSVQTGDATIIDGPALVNSPMAGKIATVQAIVGSMVEEGQSLMVLEAMKMQNEIASPKDGTVKQLFVKRGDLVKAGDRLCLID